MNNAQSNAIKRFKELFVYYKDEDYHKICIENFLLDIKKNPNLIILPKSENHIKILQNIKTELYSFILKKINNFNTNELLKEIIILHECTKFEEFILTSDIENTILTLKSFICEALPSKKNKKIDIEEFQSLIQYSFIFEVLNDNIYCYPYIDNSYNLLAYCDYILKQEDFDLYFDDYYLMQDTDKPEDINSLSSETIGILSNYKLLPDQIRESLLVDMNLGFDFNHIKALENHILSLEPLTLFVYKINNLAYLLNMDKNKLKNLVKFFSYYNRCSYDYLHIELRPFYYNNETIYLTRQETLHALTIYKNLILSDHFIEYYNLENNKKLFQAAQNKITKFFSYKIADILKQHNFLIPQNENGEIIVDIIENNTKQGEINDIDVLALNLKDKMLYNIELKYFKPAISYNKLFKDSFDNKHINNTLDREKKLIYAKEYILNKYFNINSDFDEFSIKSLMIISRVKYKAIYKDCNIKVITYPKFVKDLHTNCQL